MPVHVSLQSCGHFVSRASLFVSFSLLQSLTCESILQTKLARKPILGDALPACIVYERGEPLSEWCTRTRPDTLAVLNILCSVTQRVAELHAAGFAHRDIKPANVIWQPRTASWAVTDFGCAAPLGTQPPPHPSVSLPQETILPGCIEKRSGPCHSISTHCSLMQ